MADNIINKIEAILPSLPAKQQIVALSILQDPLSSAFFSVQELSERINVSPATIVRFAKSVTGEGFPQMQQALHAYIQTESNPIKRVQLQIDVNSKDDELLAKVYETQLENLRKTFTQDTFRQITEAYNLILPAKRIYCVGTRGSYSVSYFLGHHLNRALGNVDVILDDDRLAEFLHRAQENDVAIFTCVPRYSKRLLIAAKELKKKEVKIISINSSLNSPFLPYSTICLFSPCNSNDFHNSVIAPMLIAEFLITLIIAKVRESTIHILNDYEQYFTALDQFHNQE